MRKRLWVVVGVTGVLSVFGYLARPIDEFAAIRPFHPVERWEGLDELASREYARYDLEVTGLGRNHVLDFTCNPNDVKTALAGEPLMQDNLRVIPSPVKPGGITCQLSLHESNEPWYARSWAAIKQRLGT